MKFLLSKINLTALAILLFFLAGFGSCKKDDSMNNIINLPQVIAGTWEANSFTVDGVEIMGSVVLASKMKFEASGNDFEWKLNYGDRSGETQTGNYQMAQEGKKVELKSSKGDMLKLDVDIDGDDMTLSGYLDGERIVIKADRN